jgi:uncharacterized protein YbcI
MFCRNVTSIGREAFVKELDHKFEVVMKTQGEIEADICEGTRRFELEHMGRGPKEIHSYLVGDLIVVRLRGVLTAAEQHLVKSLPAEKGRDLLKQVRTHLIETARPIMEAMVQEVTGVKVVSLPAPDSTVSPSSTCPPDSAGKGHRIRCSTGFRLAGET